MKRWAGVMGCAMVTSAPLGCGLFEGPSLGSLTGGSGSTVEEAGAAPEVPASLDAGHGREVGVPTIITDGGTTGDFGHADADAGALINVEAGVADVGPDAPPSYCDLHPAGFCVDFDRIGDAPAWSGVAGSTTLDHTAYTSWPNALVVSAPPGPDATSYIYKVLGAPTSKVDFEFSLRIESGDLVNDYTLAAMGFGGSDGFVYLIRQTANGYTYVRQVTPTDPDGTRTTIDTIFRASVPMNEWRRLALSVDFEAMTWAITEGGEAVVGPAAVHPSLSKGVVDVDLGVYCMLASQAVTVRYDDAVANVQ